LLINVLIAAGVALAALPVIPRTYLGARRNRIDAPGALLATLGSVSLVYGFTNAETHGWLAGQTLGLFVAAVILLGAFVVLESRVAHPLLRCGWSSTATGAAPTSQSASRSWRCSASSSS
jgi:hypothetical protein